MAHPTVAELTRQSEELALQVEELTRALAQAEAVTQLTAGMVHDLRNAFHVALVAAQILGRNLQQASHLELVDAIVAATQHGTALARDMLAVARRSDRSTSLVFGGEFLRDFQRLLQRLVLARCDCSFEADPQAWPVLVQRSQLEAAMINLCVNARDAMPHGGRLRLSVRNWPSGSAPPASLPPGDFVEFSVADTGTGMSSDVLARATEAFFTTKEASGGSGLGLAMVQSFATRSGGALLIDSEPARGTRVRVVLPRAPFEAKEESERQLKLRDLASRIRDPALKQALESWRAVCPGGGLPQPLAAETALTLQAEHCLVLAADRSLDPPLLRLSRIGSAVARALGRAELGEMAIDGPVALGTLAAAYRRVLQSQFPSYEYARYGLADGAVALFERLILPAAVDGRTVSHLIGLIYLSSDLEMGGESHVGSNCK